MRDMTKAQYEKALATYGFRPQGFMGYVDVGYGVHVSVWNAGDRRRDRLAYLIRERDKAEKRYGMDGRLSGL